MDAPRETTGCARHAARLDKATGRAPSVNDCRPLVMPAMDLDFSRVARSISYHRFPDDRGRQSQH